MADERVEESAPLIDDMSFLRQQLTDIYGSFENFAARVTSSRTAGSRIYGVVAAVPRAMPTPYTNHTPPLPSAQLCLQNMQNLVTSPLLQHVQPLKKGRDEICEASSSNPTTDEDNRENRKKTKRKRKEKGMENGSIVKKEFVEPKLEDLNAAKEERGVKQEVDASPPPRVSLILATMKDVPAIVEHLGERGPLENRRMREEEKDRKEKEEEKEMRQRKEKRKKERERKERAERETREEEEKERQKLHRERIQKEERERIEKEKEMLQMEERIQKDRIEVEKDEAGKKRKRVEEEEKSKRRKDKRKADDGESKGILRLHILPATQMNALVEKEKRREKKALPLPFNAGCCVCNCIPSVAAQPEKTEPAKAADYYTAKAKEEKRRADREVDKELRVLLYLDSAVYFTLSVQEDPIFLEQHFSKFFGIIKDTIELVKAATAMLSPDSHFASRLTVMSLRLQALFNYHLYKARVDKLPRLQSQMNQLEPLVEDAPNLSSSTPLTRSTATPSPASSTQSSHTMPMLLVPVTLWSLKSSQLKTLMLLSEAHRLWLQAASSSSASDSAFFGCVDGVAPLPSFDASLHSLASWLLTAVQWMRAEHALEREHSS